MRPMIAAAAGALLVAAPEAANAGNITPIQYAYGGGSNAAAVIASRPPVSSTSTATSGPTATAAGTGSGGTGSGGTGSGGTGSGGTGSGGPGSAGGGAGSNGGHGTAAGRPLVGIAAGPAAPVGSFDALHRAIPRDALWAIALAAACALGAWLVRRGNT